MAIWLNKHNYIGLSACPFSTLKKPFSCIPMIIFSTSLKSLVSCWQASDDNKWMFETLCSLQYTFEMFWKHVLTNIFSFRKRFITRLMILHFLLYDGSSELNLPKLTNTCGWQKVQKEQGNSPSLVDVHPKKVFN